MTFDLNYLAFYIILSILLIVIVASEVRQETALTAFGNVAIIVFDKIKKLLKEKEETQQYPTGIGYDGNGIFLPYIVQEEFGELKKIFDGLFLSEHHFNDNLFSYSFKYAKMNMEMSEAELYEYLDRKVSSIINSFVAKTFGCSEIRNISAICIGKGIFTIYVARNSYGAEMNRDYSSEQYCRIKEHENEEKKPKDNIESEWKDL